MSEKQCTKCGIIKPLTSFRRHNKTKDGRRPDCKECLKAQDAAYRARNKDKARETMRAWRAHNPKRARATYEARYLRNREQILEQNAAWRRNNPDKVREYWTRRRALEKAALGEVDAQVLTDMLVSQNGCCAYCEAPLNDSYEVDHMTPLSRGGRNDWSNIALTCVSCNRRKHSKTAEEFFSL